jgi:hypothetical protein
VAKAARAAARRSATATPLATAGLDAIEAELAAQSDARAAGGCDTAAEIRVPELFVGAAKTRMLPAGTTIVAERGIRILGALRASGPGGGLTLESRAGDVVVEGTLDAAGSPAPPETTTSLARARGARARIADGRPSCGDARPLVIRSSGSDITIGEDAVFITGSGSSCDTIVVSDWSQLHERVQAPGNFGGMHGGSAGDLVLDTSDAGPPTAGRIVFLPRPFLALPPFHLGNGGLGQQLAVDPSLVPLAGSPIFRVAGGHGGDSGAARVLDENTAILDLPDRVYDPIGGRAGAGGAVVWRATGGTAFFPAGIEEVVVLGGDGGAGVLEGGAGGAASYTGDRVVNTTGTPITGATAFGGFGGFGSLEGALNRGADDDAGTGGDGGDALVIGHRGWDGSPVWKDGAEGGSATATAGFGGDANWVDDLEARGGNGGHVVGVGGRGGNGRPGSCVPEDTTAGGDGGFGGAIFLRGGEGGYSSFGTGGDGGFVFLAALGIPGLGGGGSPAGLFGDPPVDFRTAPGSGGGGRVAGVGGAVADVVIPPDDGTNYFTCEEVPPQRDPCGSPEWYQATIVERSSSPAGDTSTVIRETADYICGGPTGCRWIGHGSIETALDGGGSQTTLYSSDERSLPTDRIDTSLGTHCTAPGPAHQGSGNHTDTGPNTVVTWRHFSSGSHMCRLETQVCCRNNGGPLNPYPPDAPECRE